MGVKQSGGITIVEPRGRIDTLGAEPLRERFEALIKSGARRILVDLRRVEYISSFGFRALLVVARRLERDGGHLVLCEVPDAVMRVVEIGGFGEALTICFTRADAVRTLG